MNLIYSVPQTAATTFASSSVFILLLCPVQIKPYLNGTLYSLLSNRDINKIARNESGE